MQTKDSQAPDHPFRRSGLAGSGGSRGPSMLGRKTASFATVRPFSPTPSAKRHIKITPVVQEAPAVSLKTWPEQIEQLFSTNIAGTAKDRENDSALVVNRDFFSKWTLRYHHNAFEKQYHAYRSTINGTNSFVAVLSGIVLNVVFLAIDLLLAPSDRRARLAIVRCALVAVFIVLLLMVRFLHHKLGRFIQFISCFLAALSGAGVLACSCYAQDYVPQSIFVTQYALVIMYSFLLIHIRFLYPFQEFFYSIYFFDERRYLSILYTTLFVAYIVIVSVRGGEMVKLLPWGILDFLVLAGIALVTSYKTEQIARTEWLLITMGERSKRKREKQKETVVGLMGNILPEKVIQKIKSGHASTFAEDFANCTIMVATLCDFDVIFDRLSPTELVETLDTIFSGFDDIVGEFASLEKLKSVGVAYTVVGGATDKNSDHAQQMVECSLKMVRFAQRLLVKQDQFQTSISIRVGIHSGPAHAGLIGWTKMIYDMWGEAMTIAGLCAIHGMKDSVQVSTATYSQLHDKHNFHSDPSIISLSPSVPPISTFILTNNLNNL